MPRRLVEQAKEGDDVAFTELVDLEGDRCYAIAYRVLRDAERAQDAVQQAFLHPVDAYLVRPLKVAP